MKNIELLAPAGDQDSLIAAIQNGADAIYLGGTLFNARAFAKNFDHEQLKWAVEYAHLRDVKIYVTVNTLYKDKEFEDLIAYIDELYQLQVDALIIQDIGLFDVVRCRYPDFEVHMSTQASIMNVQAAQYFEKLGASRVVLARENTLEEIQQICQTTSLEVEVFVHGALCVCYSGQCLMSSMIGKRSGNRGACAQPCRLQYRFLKDGKVQDKKNMFLLSPKDLMTIEYIGDLIDAGVTSFKVEGRMKKPEYVASVVKAYRQAIDAHLQKKKVNLENDIETMKAMFNRDYTNGYIACDSHIVIGDYSGNKGILIGKVLGYNKQRKTVTCQLEKSLKQGDSVVFESIDKGRPVNKMYIKQKLVSQAHPKDIIEIEFDYPVRDGNVRKTVDIDVINRLQKTYQKDYRKIPIDMEFTAHLHQNARLTLKKGNKIVCVTSQEMVEQALSTPTSQERISQQLSKLGQSSFSLNQIQIDIDNQISIPIKTLNEMRREGVEKLSERLSHRIIHHLLPQTLPSLTNHSTNNEHFMDVLVSHFQQLEEVIKSHPHIIYYPYQSDAKEAIDFCQKNKQDVALFIPRICKEEDLMEIYQSSVYQMVEKVVVNDYGAYHLFSNKQRIIGTGLNVYNSRAIAHYHEPIILSLEMSQKEIHHLTCDFQKCILPIYGKVENMISEYCPISQYYFGYQKKNCQLCHHHQFSLLDRKNEVFDLMMDEKCRMHLLNCHPLFIEPYQETVVAGYFIHFTNEDREMTKFIMNDLKNIIENQKKSCLKEKISTTSGYFRT
ncbi:MAG: DUF3656 domain-containing U32 family peptidase [Longibaculum sp.]